MSFHKLACGLIIKLYIDTQREVQFLPVYYKYYDHFVLKIYMA